MWIESHGNLARHPKTRRLMQRMGWTLPFTMGNLHLLWWWALDFAPSGDLSRFEPEQLTYDLDLGGAKPEQFIEAMVAAGFLERLSADSIDSHPDGNTATPESRPGGNDALIIHDWLDYTAKSLRSKFRRVDRREQPEPSKVSERQVTLAASRNDQMVEHGPQGAVRVDCIEQCSSRHGGSEVSGSERSQMALRAVRREATTDSAVAEQEPLSNPAVVDVPGVLAALPGFADTWWPKLLDIHEAKGTPLSTDAQRELLASLAEKPLSAVGELRTRIIKAANAFARTELLNTS